MLIWTNLKAFFSYRLFGPDQTVSEKPLKKVEQYEQVQFFVFIQ